MNVPINLVNSNSATYVPAVSAGTWDWLALPDNIADGYRELARKEDSRQADQSMTVAAQALKDLRAMKPDILMLGVIDKALAEAVYDKRIGRK